MKKLKYDFTKKINKRKQPQTERVSYHRKQSFGGRYETESQNIFSQFLI